MGVISDAVKSVKPYTTKAIMTFPHPLDFGTRAESYIHATGYCTYASEVTIGEYETATSSGDPNAVYAILYNPFVFDTIIGDPINAGIESGKLHTYIWYEAPVTLPTIAVWKMVVKAHSSTAFASPSGLQALHILSQVTSDDYPVMFDNGLFKTTQFPNATNYTLYGVTSVLSLDKTWHFVAGIEEQAFHIFPPSGVLDDQVLFKPADLTIDVEIQQLKLPYTAHLYQSILDQYYLGGTPALSMSDQTLFGV